MRASAFRLPLGEGDSTGAATLLANVCKPFYSSDSVFCLARETALGSVARSHQLGRDLRSGRREATSAWVSRAGRASQRSREREAGEHRAPAASPAGRCPGPACCGCVRGWPGGILGGRGDNSRALGFPSRERERPRRRPAAPSRPRRGCALPVTHGSRDRIGPRPSQAGHASRGRAQALCGQPGRPGAAFFLCDISKR